MEKKQRNLNAAAKAKKDEFYTQLTDIEKEMRYYRKHFRGKQFCVIAMIRLKATFSNTLY